MPLPKDFKFPANVEDAASIPPEAKALYTKNAEGTWDLDDVVKQSLDTTTLSSTLSKERKSRAQFEKLVEGFKALGLGDTPEEALASIKKYEESDDDEDTPGDKKEKKQNIKEMRAKLQAEFETTLNQSKSESQTQLDNMRKSLHKNLVEKEALAALAKHKGSTALLLPHVSSKIGLVEEDGEYHVRVLDADGAPVGDGRGGFKTVDAFVQEMKADAEYKVAFESSGKTGTGAKPGETNKRISTGSENRSSVDKINAGLQSL